MEKEFEEIHSKLDKMNDSIINIDKTLIRQEGSLNEHMARSLHNEKAIDILKAELMPIKTYMIQTKTVVKIIMALCGSISTAAMIYFEFFHK